MDSFFSVVPRLITKGLDSRGARTPLDEVAELRMDDELDAVQADLARARARSSALKTVLSTYSHP